MLLSAFIATYNHPTSIILLEGKRKVLPRDEEKLFALGKLVAQQLPLATFRSGNAPGADELFSKGVAEIDPGRLHLIKPYQSHRAEQTIGYNAIGLDELDIAAEPELIYQTKITKRLERIVDQYVAGEKTTAAFKAAYLIRDTAKVIGATGIAPATVGLFYDDLANPRHGGTGHTMRVCEANGVPVLDQTAWMEWLG